MSVMELMTQVAEERNQVRKAVVPTRRTRVLREAVPEAGAAMAEPAMEEAVKVVEELLRRWR